MHDVVRLGLRAATPPSTLRRYARFGAVCLAAAVLAVGTAAAAKPVVGGVRVALFDATGATMGTGLFTDASAQLRIKSDIAGFLTLVVVRPESGAAFFDAFVSFNGSLVVVSDAGFEHLDTFFGQLTDAELTVAIVDDFDDDAGTDAWEGWLVPDPPPTDGSHGDPDVGRNALGESDGEPTDGDGEVDDD